MTLLVQLKLGIGVLLLFLGALVSALSVIGMFRLRDIYLRMHAVSKAVTLGSAMSLLGVGLVSTLDVALKAFGIIVFLFIGTPIASFALARAAHRRGEPRSARMVLDELERDRRPR